MISAHLAERLLGPAAAESRRINYVLMVGSRQAAIGILCYVLDRVRREHATAAAAARARHAERCLLRRPHRYVLRHRRRRRRAAGRQLVQISMGHRADIHRCRPRLDRVYANAPTSGGSSTHIDLEATPNRVGTYALAGDDNNTLVFNPTPDAQRFFLFVSGSLHIDDFTGGRAKGSFAGKAVSAGGADTLVISGGTFDVPFTPSRDRALTSAQLPCSSACQRAIEPTAGLRHTLI